MPMLKRADAEIHYEIHGADFPSCFTRRAA